MKVGEKALTIVRFVEWRGSISRGHVRAIRDWTVEPNAMRAVERR